MSGVSGREEDEWMLEASGREVGEREMQMVIRLSQTARLD